MSWSISAIGKAEAVARYAKEQANAYRNAEPEETMKQKAAEIICLAAESSPGNGLKVEANGHQQTVHDPGPGSLPHCSYHSFNLKIETITFVE
jgi:hypothetical protein